METNKLSIKSNSFDYLKIIAAYSVVAVHVLKFGIVTSPSELSNSLRKILLCIPGVVIFFTISGFLVSSSFNQSKNIMDFVKKRFIRIYPPLWVSVIIYSAFYMFFLNIDIKICIKFLINLIGVGYTPTELDSMLTGSFNGALWTVFITIQFYFFLIIFNKHIKSFSIKKWVFILFISLGINVCLGLLNFSMSSTFISRSIFPYMFFFLSGSFCYYNFDKVIPILIRYVYLLLLVYLMYCFLGRPYSELGFYSPLFTSLISPFLTIGLAYRFGEHRIKYEFSYSLYLYHWLFVNIALIFPKINMNIVYFLAFVLFFSTFTAILSYILLEKPPKIDKR